MKNFFKNLQFIFRPKFWSMNYTFNKEWDKEFNVLLDNYVFTNIDNYTAKLGDTEIWITNYPYACFRKYGYNEFRPSKLTMFRANKILKIDKLRQEIHRSIYPPRPNGLEILRREILEIQETLDNLKASNYKNDIMGNIIIKKHKFK